MVCTYSCGMRRLVLFVRIVPERTSQLDFFGSSRFSVGWALLCKDARTESHGFCKYHAHNAHKRTMLTMLTNAPCLQCSQTHQPHHTHQAHHHHEKLTIQHLQPAMERPMAQPGMHRFPLQSRNGLHICGGFHLLSLDSCSEAQWTLG